MTMLTDHAGRVIRVLVADDSAVMRSALSRLLQSDKDIKVVGVAKDGLNAVQQVGALEPDVVTLDVEMPVMNGLAASCWRRACSMASPICFWWGYFR